MVSFSRTHYRISLRRSFARGAYRLEGPIGQRGLQRVPSTVEGMGPFSRTVITKEDLVFCLVLSFGLEPSSYERARRAKRILLRINENTESASGGRIQGESSVGV